MKILIATALLMYVFGNGNNASHTSRQHCNATNNRPAAGIAGQSFKSSLILDSKMLVQ